LTMSKKEIEKHFRKTERDFEKVLMEKRVEWLNRICREARDTYSFASLGELIAFIVDHASDIQLKSGDPEKP